MEAATEQQQLSSRISADTCFTPGWVTVVCVRVCGPQHVL
jgi:hypothetical protein